MTGPHGGKCASPLCGPGILMLGLASNEGLGITGRDVRGVASLAYPQVSRYLSLAYSQGVYLKDRRCAAQVYSEMDCT